MFENTVFYKIILESGNVCQHFKGSAFCKQRILCYS